MTLKNAAIVLPILEDRKTFAEDIGQYGNLWAKKYKNDEQSLPTPSEMIEGLM